MRFAFIFLALAFASGMALAADVTGNWKGQLTTPNGDKIDVQYTFKQDGATLTGSTMSPHGESVELTEGRVDGNTLSFTVELKMNGGMKLPHTGKISGDTIELQVHLGEQEPMTFKLTRATS